VDELIDQLEAQKIRVEAECRRHVAHVNHCVIERQTVAGLRRMSFSLCFGFGIC
jgi:hypothetical protein